MCRARRGILALVMCCALSGLTTLRADVPTAADLPEPESPEGLISDAPWLPALTPPTFDGAPYVVQSEPYETTELIPFPPAAAIACAMIASLATIRAYKRRRRRAI